MLSEQTIQNYYNEIISYFPDIRRKPLKLVITIFGWPHCLYPMNSIIFSETNGLTSWIFMNVAGWFFWLITPLSLANLKDDGSIRYDNMFPLMMIISFSVMLFIGIFYK